MTRVIAVANQKGGVAKTTTVQSLAAAFAELGRQVLVVDLDPQACLTYSMGFDSEGLELSIHDVMLGRTTAAKSIIETGDVHLLPSTIDLAGAEIHLLTKTGREYVLRKALQPVLSTYDVVMIDCPPSLGILTINGLTAGREVLVPLQAETLSHRGVGQLLETIDDVRAYTNSDLQVLGAVATMFDSRTRLAREVVEDLPQRYGITVLDPPIPKTVRVAEAPARGISVLHHARHSKASDAYRALALNLDQT
jgi:chromosome partitioning protein